MRVTPSTATSLLHDLLMDPAPPKERLGRSRAINEHPFFKQLAHAHTREATALGLDVRIAAQLDGAQAVVAQQLWGSFNPTRRREATGWALAELAKQDVAGRIVTTVRETAARLAVALVPDEVTLLVVPADPANASLMLRERGLSVHAFRDVMVVEVWPSASVVARLPLAVARALARAMLRAAHPAEAPTLRDHLALEGLAWALTEELHGVDAVARCFAADAAGAGAWRGELAHVAALQGAASVEAIATNIYGDRVRYADVTELPPCGPLGDDEVDYTAAVLAEARDAVGAGTVAAYLYGDDVVKPQGHAPVGLSVLAGMRTAPIVVRRALRDANLMLAEGLVADVRGLLRRA